MRKCPKVPSVCLPVEQYCDGIAQCPDGGDEIQSGCTCKDWGLISCKHGETQLSMNCLNRDWASGVMNESNYECHILLQIKSNLIIGGKNHSGLYSGLSNV